MDNTNTIIEEENEEIYSAVIGNSMNSTIFKFLGNKNYNIIILYIQG